MGYLPLKNPPKKGQKGVKKGYFTPFLPFLAPFLTLAIGGPPMAQNGGGEKGG